MSLIDSFLDNIGCFFICLIVVIAIVFSAAYGPQIRQQNIDAQIEADRRFNQGIDMAIKELEAETP